MSHPPQYPGHDAPSQSDAQQQYYAPAQYAPPVPQPQYAPPAPPAAESSTAPRLNRLFSNVELLTAVLLGLVSVSTAYVSFQAALYDGETTKQFSEGQNLQTEAESLYLEANQTYIRDVQLWDRMTELSIEMEGADAATAQLKYDTLLFTSVSETLNEAIVWSADQNAADPSVFHSPFDSEDYQGALYGAWAETDEASAAAFAAGDAADAHGDKLTLTTVLMAISLFLLGVGAVARRLSVQLVLMGVGTAIWLVSLAMAASVPFTPFTF